MHRDIKPANVILGRHGETLVLDWGLAKTLGRSDPGSGERTLVPSSTSGSVETLRSSALGTPAFTSPEQAEGDLDRIGPRSDVYSLGATLYCLLTGKPHFEGDVADVLRAVQKGDILPPRQIDMSIEASLEAVCLKAMSLQPGHRYAAPMLLAEEIERWLADESVAAWPEPWTTRRPTPARPASHAGDGLGGGGRGAAPGARRAGPQQPAARRLQRSTASRGHMRTDSRAPGADRHGP